MRAFLMKVLPWLGKNGLVLFKAIWYVVLIAGAAYFIFPRLNELRGGTGNPSDLAFAAVFIALALLPFYSEFSLFGLTIKRQIEETKKEIKQDVQEKISSLRNDIQNAVSVSSNVAPNIYVGPPESQLGNIENRFNAMFDSISQQLNINRNNTSNTATQTPEDVSRAFSYRYNIEQELRRVVETYLPDEEIMLNLSNSRKIVPVSVMLRSLVNAKIIAPEFASSIRDVYGIASAIVHGQSATTQRIEVLDDIAPKLVDTLRALQRQQIHTF